MVGWMIALVGSLWLSAAPALQTSSPRPDRGPASEGRLFPLRSREAWQRVQTRLEELGFSKEKLDRTNQVIITSWRNVDAKGMEWLRLPPLPEPYVAERVRFEVFVSPFAEPARVYVGSMMEVRDRLAGSRARATAYNLAEPNAALMAEIAIVLGAASLLIYSPGRLEGCPVPSVVTYTVRYHR